MSRFPERFLLVDKVDQIDKLVAKFKILTRNHAELQQMIKENADERGTVAKQLAEYLTHRDIGLLVDLCPSNISRIIARVNGK